ncbi:tRNA (adenosine(37)-N6)-threonylcarbamoyltransferase complex transferase subunit TsaD [Candidatus Woesebacteria bacterium]|nr:tRNA (adenosine(37)-N6)-threonylcarbamoyltransferase complex transferase subunit TsaD [Candidatus Woesebacteria bacterium]
MIFLGIDTSCDDTSIAVLRDRQVLANIISSQDDTHKEYGGVVPILAKREHEKNFPIVLDNALHTAGVTPAEIDHIAVTIGPGLAPSLEVGVEQAQRLAAEWKKPLEPIHHMEGHLLSALATDNTGNGGPDPDTVTFPALGILASGGHTEMVLIRAWGKYEIIGETVDDALGEAYDKVARMLGLGFPGGGKLAGLAEQGNPNQYDLPIAMRQSGDYNVSYSGIKTATLRLVRELTNNGQKELTPVEMQDVAASFQRAALQTLLQKVKKSSRLRASKTRLSGRGSCGKPSPAGRVTNTSARSPGRTVLAVLAAPLSG